jgi:hypothetical protein
MSENKFLPIIKVHRFWQDDNQSSGIAVVLKEDGFPAFASLSLERGWRGNKKGESCIPIGVYDLVLEYSNRFKTDLWEVKNVPNRDECKFHAANYYHQLNGCIALGLRSKKINSDNYMDVTNSGDTMRAFHEALKGHKKAVLVVSGDDKIK